MTADKPTSATGQSAPAFELFQPEAPESPVVVEVPHAALRLDPATMALCIAPVRSIGQDADLFVDQLYQNAPQWGAHLLAGTFSRYVCDLNRDENELDQLTAPSGQLESSPHGVIWRKSTEGRACLAAPLSEGEVERRLSQYYRPYHLALTQLIAEKKKKFGFALLLCAHSMPSLGRLGERRADVVPGSRGCTTTSQRVLVALEHVASQADYDIAHDAPYRGGFTTAHFGFPSAGIHAVQVELSRRLYMDESTLEQKPAEFRRCREFCDALVQALGALRLNPDGHLVGPDDSPRAR